MQTDCGNFNFYRFSARTLLQLSHTLRTDSTKLYFYTTPLRL